MHACLFLIKRQNKAGLKDWLQTRDDLGRHPAAVCYAREGGGHACGKEIAWQDLKVSECCCVAACACVVTCQQALLEADAFDERIQREVDVFISLNQVCPLIPSHNTTLNPPAFVSDTPSPHSPCSSSGSCAPEAPACAGWCMQSVAATNKCAASAPRAFLMPLAHMCG
jgi:hypothetical protein